MAPRPAKTILGAIFNTPVKKRRLRKFFGCTFSHLYKLLSGERPSLVVRFLQLVELAFETDERGARRLAELPLERYHELIGIRARTGLLPDNRTQSNIMLVETAQAVAAFNRRDVRQMSDEEIIEAHTEIQDARHEMRVAYEVVLAEVSHRSAARHARQVAEIGATAPSCAGGGRL